MCFYLDIKLGLIIFFTLTLIFFIIVYNIVFKFLDILNIFVFYNKISISIIFKYLED